MNEQKEPFGYFRVEPFGWVGCGEKDEGAVALYDQETVDALQGRCDELLKQRDELLKIAKDVIGMLENCSVESGVCHCGDDMARHSSAMSCGHAPVDMGSTYAAHLYEKALAAIASVKGGVVSQPVRCDNCNTVVTQGEAKTLFCSGEINGVRRHVISLCPSCVPTKKDRGAA